MYGVIGQVPSAIRTVFRNPIVLFAFLLLIPTIALLLFLIPVFTIPGNSAALQLEIFTLTEHFLLVFVAALEALLLVMFIHLFGAPERRRLRTTVGSANLGLVSGIPAFLFGTKLCPMCIAAVFGFLGPGAVFSILRYRTWIFAASAAVLLLSIYSIARKINGACGRCVEVPHAAS